jgi:hypothetical protein
MSTKRKSHSPEFRANVAVEAIKAEDRGFPRWRGYREVDEGHVSNALRSAYRNDKARF